jgi:hypothetical protein
MKTLDFLSGVSNLHLIDGRQILYVLSALNILSAGLWPGSWFFLCALAAFGRLNNHALKDRDK